MFSFEGDFKTRPKVSLGGASRKVRRPEGLTEPGPRRTPACQRPGGAARRAAAERARAGAAGAQS